MPQVASYDTNGTYGPFTTDKTLILEVWGAQGGGYRGYGVQGTTYYDTGGRGGYVKTQIVLTAGDTLTLQVGIGGPWGSINGTGTTGALAGGQGGLGGAGHGTGGYGHTGGGRSMVQRGGTLLVVAGGGGGASGAPFNGLTGTLGGAGGGSTGGAGGTATSATGGGGGTQAATGSGGATNGTGGSGPAPSLGAGGNGGAAVANNGFGGGGAGAGYYGGGGGGRGGATAGSAGGGGGGGSSYINPTGTSNTINTQGERVGNGRIVITAFEQAPLPPVQITPAGGSVVSSDVPTFGAKLVTEFLGTAPQQGKAKIEWQVATDQSFTAGVKTFTEPDSKLAYGSDAGVLHTLVIPASQRLSQGNWFLRARAIDWNGSASAWSAFQSFSVSQVATTTDQSPSGDTTVTFVATGSAFAWRYSSTNFGSQSAYQVSVETVAGGPIHDTGKVLSSSLVATVVIPASYKNQPLRWRVKVWDVDGIEGVWSTYHLFRVGDVPSIVVDAIGTISTPSPTVTWTATPGGGIPLSQKRMFVTKDSDGSVVYDSGWI